MPTKENWRIKKNEAHGFFYIELPARTHFKSGPFLTQGDAEEQLEIFERQERIRDAAPALLAACQMVVERWETHDGQIRDIKLVRDAIAQATE
jgi:hypothetical protein